MIKKTEGTTVNIKVIILMEDVFKNCLTCWTFPFDSEENFPHAVFK